MFVTYYTVYIHIILVKTIFALVHCNVKDLFKKDCLTSNSYYFSVIKSIKNEL